VIAFHDEMLECITDGFRVSIDRKAHRAAAREAVESASANAPEHKRETLEHGGQGCTNNASELFEMVTRAVVHRLAA
jgi:hypothetical protein